MAYDTSKLTTLGQIKTALQRVANAISGSKSTRQLVTIQKTNWTLSTDVYVYPGVLTVSNYNYYNVHLAPDSSRNTILMCSQADIAAKIVNSEIQLYCYNMPDDPSQFDNFQIEIIATPTKSNDVGLSYSIGTASADTRVDTMILSATSVPVATNKWQDLGVAETYRYYATINMSGVTPDHFAMVQFSDADSATMSANVTTGNGTITIYSTEIPASSIVIPSILCYKGVPAIIS